MSDTPPTETPATSSNAIPPTDGAGAVLRDERQMALVIYILYLAHFVPVFGWVAAIVGLVLAHVERETAPDWLRSHFVFQIRTFWIGLLYYSISLLCCIILIGFPMLLAVSVWFIVRCALGISRLSRGEAYPTPESWTV